MVRGAISLIILVITFTISSHCLSGSLVNNLEVSAIGQLDDDEESPFEVIAANKVHKCGGKSSNRFLVYSEDPDVGLRRFTLVLEAMRNNWTLTLKTDGCEGSALRAFEVRAFK